MYVNEFIAYLQTQKRFSPHSILAYRNDLSQFLLFLEENEPVRDVTEISHLHIRSWIVFLMENGLDPRSVNRKLSTLKSFYRFLIIRKVVEKSPMNKVISPKTSKKLPVFVEKEKMDNLFNDIVFPDDFEGCRDKMILELFYMTGMRVSELVNLNESDFDFYAPSVKVLGKRNKERIIPLHPEFIKHVQDYLSIKHASEKETGHSALFFITKKGKKFYQKLAYNVVKHYLSGVTSISKRSPHVLRHTFATHMLNNGADLNAIKELLGHSSLAATQVYTHNTIEKLSRIYKQAHPRA
ncbi:MAG: tyrosine-type recombinase/integrase [Bacteroidota bacterium]